MPMRQTPVKAGTTPSVFLFEVKCVISYLVGFKEHLANRVPGQNDSGV